MTKLSLLKLRGLPLGIGSLPYKDPAYACDKVLSLFPESPFWPELSKRDWREGMGYIQSEGLPGMREDKDRGIIYLDNAVDLSDELATFYTRFIANEISDFAMTPAYASGLAAMRDLIAHGRPPGIEFMKGQLSGPTTFGLIIKDAAGKAVLYDEQLMDTLIKGSIMKARWIIDRWRGLGLESVIFFDEPMLQSIGSPSVPIDKEQAAGYLNEVVNGVDCVTGAHCCGNTDWSILMDAEIDIIAFDAYRFTETIALYPRQLQSFLDRGGALAWGIVPSEETAKDHTVASLTRRLKEAFEMVAKAGIDKDQLMNAAMVTPSCGLGSLSIELADKILELTRGVSDWLREELT